MRHWPQIRAALVALAIVVGLLDGLPLPAVSRAPGSMQGAVRAIKQVRHAALIPFKPIGELLRLRQTWRLFPTADDDQMRMWVEGRNASTRAWEILYRPHDDEHDFMADQLEYRRVRGTWNPGSRGSRSGYGPFVQWLAREVFARRDDLDRVRVRMEAIRLEPEDGLVRGLGSFTHEKVERRPR